jgi:hypothetical protein
MKKGAPKGAPSRCSWDRCATGCSTRNSCYSTVDWRDSPETEPLHGLKMTIHGLRATKIDDLRRAGTEDGAIADEIAAFESVTVQFA